MLEDDTGAEIESDEKEVLTEGDHHASVSNFSLSDEEI